MKRVFVFTLFFITLAAVLLFLETIRIQFFKPQNMHGTFVYVSYENAGERL